MPAQSSGFAVLETDPGTIRQGSDPRRIYRRAASRVGRRSNPHHHVRVVHAKQVEEQNKIILTIVQSRYKKYLTLRKCQARKMISPPPPITSAQCKAARALIAWSQKDLAAKSKVAVATIADFERGHRTPIQANLDALRRALEGEGVTFLTGGAVAGPPPQHQRPLQAGRSPFRWITSGDLAQWADRLDSQAKLPELISRLIRASTGEHAKLRFPADDSITQPGWDGTCEIENETGFVPGGYSVWELSTQKNSREKAEKDLQKRTKTATGVNPARATFVFVTPRRWARKQEWLAKHFVQRTWAHVRVYDADDLVHWIELFPAVGHWLAVQIGKRPPAVQQLEEAWSEWSLSTKWPMSEALTIVGRDDEVTRVLRWLRDEPSVLAVQADSPNEAIAFLYAALANLPPQNRTSYLTRCLVAGTPDAARHLAESSHPLIIALDDSDPGLATRLAQRSHHIYVAYGSDVGAPDDVLRLARPPRNLIVDELLQMMRAITSASVDNRSEDRRVAESLAKDSARSLAVLRRLIPSAPGRFVPEWAEQNFARSLIAPLLLGAWDENVPGDRAALERLADQKYESIIQQLAKWVALPDSPIRKAGTAWKIASPRDAWFRIADNITSGDLDRFEYVALNILTSTNPLFDIEPTQRWRSQFDGKRPEYSDLIRTGTAEALVLLSLFPQVIRSVPNAEKRSQGIVRKVLHTADSKRWWSLKQQLRLLAEAAPNVFLSAVEDSLAQFPSPLMALFKEDEGGVIGNEHLSGLLWSLETLAWDSECFPKVARLLAALARRDPDGKWQNRPKNSLRSIFLLWYPQTNASFNERIEVLDALRTEEPKVSWKLLLSLLPRGHDVATPSPQPRWRDFSVDNPKEVTRSEIAEGAGRISSWLLADVGHNAKRWTQLIKVLPNLSSDHRQRAAAQLKDAAPLFDDEGRSDVSTSLRSLISHHMSFSNSGWALPVAELKRFDEAIAALEPKDEVERLVWLFASEHVPLLNPTGRGFQDDEEEAWRLRREAVSSLLARGKVHELLRLASKVDMPALVGAAIADVSTDAAFVESTLIKALHADDKSRGIAHGIIVREAARKGVGWIDALISQARTEKWSQEVTVRMLLSIPHSKRLWDQVGSFGSNVENSYWSQIGIPWIRDEDEAIPFALNKLIDAGQALRAVYFAGRHKEKISSQLLSKVLAEAARADWPTDPGNEAVMFQHDVAEILQDLDARKEVPEKEIASLEWQYLALLQYSNRKPVILHKTLSEDPQFFVHVLSALYKPDPESGVEDDKNFDTAHAQAMASHAFNLLDSWVDMPGKRGAIVNYGALKSWIDDARKLAQKRGRRGIGDHEIGKVLSCAPPDDDGLWPAAAVRAAIEAIASSDLEAGFINGVYNKRGATWRSLTEGGEQERGLAKNYRDWASKTRIKWPRTSSVLDRIAATYEEEARWHDQRAERTDW